MWRKLDCVLPHDSDTRAQLRSQFNLLQQENYEQESLLNLPGEVYQELPLIGNNSSWLISELVELNRATFGKIRCENLLKALLTLK